MKSYRLDLTGGVNVVADKSILPAGQPTIMPGYYSIFAKGWCSVADGVDFRSGQARPFNAYTFIANTTNDTTSIFSYKNQIYTSARWRDWASDTVAGQDRIFWTEYGGSAKKSIYGIEIPLGTFVPSTAPLTSNTVITKLILSVIQSSTGGLYYTGTSRSYRVAAILPGGVQIPCQEVTVIFSNATVIHTHSATLTWNSVPNAVGYLIFAGSSGNETVALKVNSSQLTAIDDGSWTSGESIDNYVAKNNYVYAYTFQRDFKGMLDESGVSPLSVMLDPTLGKEITFTPLSDGFFSQPNRQVITDGTPDALTKDSNNNVNITTTIITRNSASAGTSSIEAGSVYVNYILHTTTFTLHTDLNLTQYDSVFFTDTNDVQVGDIVPITTGASPTLIVVNSTLPYLVDTLTVNVAKTYIEWTPPSQWSPPQSSPDISEGDVVYIDRSTYPEFTSGTYRAHLETPVTDGNLCISISQQTISATGSISSFRFIPGNGYITYRNLYRIGSGGSYGLVEQIPIWKTIYQDTISDANLGESPTSYYVDNGVQVIYEPAPVGLTGLTRHYDMFFGIIGNLVRWTPVGQPDAWPAVFSQSFPYPPVALESFAQSLIVLCEDTIYRLDGTSPVGLTVTKTLVEDGCIAPYSVQKTTEAGLLYLSRKGVMSFDGMHAKCITDISVPARFWQSPSYGNNQLSGLIPTLSSYNYAAFAYEDGIRSDVAIGYAQHLNNIAPGLIRDIKSFVWNGKYFVFWTNTTGNYGAHTCVCVDLRLQGFPITTLPLQLLAAHTDETGRVRAVIRDTVATQTTVTIVHETHGA